MAVGKSIIRVDACEKVTGGAQYTADLEPKGALVAKVVRSTIANGEVKGFDLEAALAVPGVVKIVTCFDVPDYQFPTAGHPWSVETAHQDIADRKLLNTRVRVYGDDIAAVVAEDEIAAARAARLVMVEYEEYPPLLTPEEALAEGAAQLHDEKPGNLIAHSGFKLGELSYEEAAEEEGLVVIDKKYGTQSVQHCHIETPVSFAYMEKGRIVVTTSTQIPHIVRRVISQALGVPMGMIRVIKPYIGGGFGNKQDVLYEPLNAYLCTLVGGRCVKMEISREETLACTRVRHAMDLHVKAAARKDGTLVARKLTAYSNQGGYASHAHAIVANTSNEFKQIYHDEKALEADAYTVYTNIATGGAMRGYGIPQAAFAAECMADDLALQLGMDPLEFRRKNCMQDGYEDPHTHVKFNSYGLRECMEKGREFIGWDEKRREYANQTGPVRKGIGMAIFCYKTGVYPISLETASCRMVLNQDGSMQLMMGATEIGQGADTAYAQMTAEAVGLKSYHDVRVVSCQDTDITPTGLGAYASRQTYVAGFSIRQTATLLRQKILQYATKLTRQAVSNMDIVDGNIIRKGDGMVLMSLKDLAMTAQYNAADSEHITAESTYTIRNNAYSFGCTFADVEVDIPMCKVTLKKIINVHDCGKLINPALAEAQVHGGMSMAIGFGMSEQLLFDEKTGRPLNNNLLDYKLSTFMDHPHLEAQFIENPEPTSPFGTKALGEPPACSGAPAIRNAIYNATGVAIDTVPITPHVLYAEFSKAGLIHDSWKEEK